MTKTILAVAAALMLSSGIAHADSDDDAYLAALHHGGLCCPEQLDLPISYGDPATEISDAHWIANTMRESDTPIGGNETYAGFKTLSHTIYKNSNGPGKLHPLNPFQSGEMVVVATHYYAGPAIECALIKQMGDDANYWYGRPRAVAPNCV